MALTPAEKQRRYRERAADRIRELTNKAGRADAEAAHVEWNDIRHMRPIQIVEALGKRPAVAEQVREELNRRHAWKGDRYRKLRDAPPENPVATDG